MGVFARLGESTADGRGRPSSKKPVSYHFEILEQDSTQNNVGNRKVDDQSRDINQGGDKGS